jgi:hypothetical protein
MDKETGSVAELLMLADNARKVCEGLGMNPANTPWVVGFINTGSISDEAIKRGKELAEEHGW